MRAGTSNCNSFMKEPYQETASPMISWFLMHNNTLSDEADCQTIKPPVTQLDEQVHCLNSVQYATLSPADKTLFLPATARVAWPSCIWTEKEIIVLFISSIPRHTKRLDSLASKNLVLGCFRVAQKEYQDELLPSPGKQSGSINVELAQGPMMRSGSIKYPICSCTASLC